MSSFLYWHDLPAGPNPPDTIYAVVEVPKGNRNKYEYDKETGVIKLDRVLYSALHYPGDYGFIPQTYFEDDDPLDVLVMINAPTFAGCLVEARPVGIFRMVDKGENDYKILAVPATDPTFHDFRELDDIPKHFPIEVDHFFMTYKQLEGAQTTNDGWGDAQEARETIQHSMALYKEKFNK
jgi:inorganic pyrophosphatase